jgi:hypothetical protein
MFLPTRSDLSTQVSPITYTCHIQRPFSTAVCAHARHLWHKKEFPLSSSSEHNLAFYKHQTSASFSLPFPLLKKHPTRLAMPLLVSQPFCLLQRVADKPNFFSETVFSFAVSLNLLCKFPTKGLNSS